MCSCCLCFFKRKTAYEMRISDWSSDVCSSDLLLFPPGQPHHLPIGAITGTNGKTTTSHMLAHILQQAGKHVGLVSTLGARVDGKVIAKGDLAGPLGFDMVARNPNVDAIVAEVARGALIRRGIGFKTCAVGPVTNITKLGRAAGRARRGQDVKNP